MGISEQDMVSFAGGLALAGRLPVVNTYAAFLKRAYRADLRQRHARAPRVIYAGHYAGLCYFTDGKTHQSLNDLSLMLTVPGLAVVEPVTPLRRELPARLGGARGAGLGLPSPPAHAARAAASSRARAAASASRSSSARPPRASSSASARSALAWRSTRGACRAWTTCAWWW